MEMVLCCASTLSGRRIREDSAKTFFQLRNNPSEYDSWFGLSDLPASRSCVSKVMAGVPMEESMLSNAEAETYALYGYR
jgi:hypothetical protein